MWTKVTFLVLMWSFPLEGLPWFMIFWGVRSYHLYIYPSLRKITVKEIYWQFKSHYSIKIIKFVFSVINFRCSSRQVDESAQRFFFLNLKIQLKQRVSREKRRNWRQGHALSSILIFIACILTECECRDSGQCFSKPQLPQKHSTDKCHRVLRDGFDVIKTLAF